MLALKLILISVLVLAASGDCAGEQCAQEGADHAELMQRHAVAKSVPKSTMMQKQSTVKQKEIDDMLVTMKDIFKRVGDKGKLPPSEQSKVATIKTLVEQNLIPTVQATRDDAEKEALELHAAILLCGNQSTQMQGQVASTHGSAVSSSRVSHSTCREQEDILFKDKEAKCQDLDVFVSSITNSPNGATLPQAPAGSTPDADAMGDYLKAMDAYFCGKHDIWVTKNGACVNATTVLTNKTSTCDHDQTQFEANFCLWRVALEDTCQNSQTCYAAARAAYETRKNEIKPAMINSWKAEWTGLHKIKCYVDIWMSDSNVTTVDKQKPVACDALIVDTTPMDIVFPACPPMTPCDVTPVSKYPCTPEFLTGEYGNLLHTKPCNAPPSCAGTPSPPPPPLSDDDFSPPPSNDSTPSDDWGGDDWGAPGGGDDWGPPPDDSLPPPPGADDAPISDDNFMPPDADKPPR
eukprot:gnl/TRDRNA2_/TRDRNA2_173531_c0_seq1.p1 gnl/TRDRNA2_/TRDRNA2_173531_c0~~gnl/TRDRNA2_/TRDRNA2_173531_c0_seq1.p1  ORF type:complete len:463 (-),score=96.47 gnl/TRDRNA2_/TRDRNA2_173531_c0_seq1:219-1607(-)